MTRKALWCSLWVVAAVAIWWLSFALASSGASSRTPATPPAPPLAAPATIGSRYTPMVTGSARVCPRCSRALDSGELVVFARDGRAAFRGCGDCLCELLADYERSRGGQR